MNNINNIGGKSKKFTKPKKSIKPENKFTKTLLDKLKTFLFYVLLFYLLLVIGINILLLFIIKLIFLFIIIFFLLLYKNITIKKFSKMLLIYKRIFI